MTDDEMRIVKYLRSFADLVENQAIVFGTVRSAMLTASSTFLRKSANEIESGAYKNTDCG